MDELFTAMLACMTAEEKDTLKSIFEPTVVTVPPGDAGRNMCVTPDGEIRVYGREEELNQWGARGGKAIYYASTNCGLSWQKHSVKKEAAIGCAGRNPNTGRYISVYPNEFRCEWKNPASGEGTWAILNDEGFDSADNRYVRISEKNVHCLKTPKYYESMDRWFILGEVKDEQKIKRIVVSFSDDDGEHWTTNILEKTAPAFVQLPPHKGVRWQEYSCEPTMVERSDGSLLMYVRTSQDYHYEYVSKDHGETWSDPKPTAFHGTITMPILHKLRDGRILLFWCNTQPMPEIDHTAQIPKLSADEIAGVWEDAFTNRDVNHLAISEDDGKTWRGFRELFLNENRWRADFRRMGGGSNGDKSVHQAEILELPFNKIMVHFGQHRACRKVVILDVDWLYETCRKEDFLLGLTNLTTHMYLKSVLGSGKGRRGHCAYNRTDGAILLPCAEQGYEEVLSIGRVEDERLVYKKQGAVWNFPASKTGTVELELQVQKSGVKLSLCDHWCNAFDETVGEQAFVSFDVCQTDGWEKLSLRYDTVEKTAELIKDGTVL
ncbi:MAG: glycoside hydrolase, partial [Clostridia bacterium]|nr:glycoside hydrolase [Clostridia bacterium]